MACADASLPSRSGQRVLLVEGQDDRHVIEHLYRKRFGVEPPFDVLDKDGYSPLREAIGVELKAPGRQVVGIVVDANGDPGSRWSAVTDRLRRVRPDIEFGNPTSGGFVGGGAPRIGIWLWPDNTSSGEIEDFVSGMIPDNDPVWPLSRRYIDGIPARHRRFSAGKTPRAELHAWLAAKAEPRRMGFAIRAGDLKVDGELATRFANWLDTLLGERA